MDGDEKKCPRCAETVKAEAKVCRHCGYNFETGEDPATHVFPVPPQKKRGFTKGCLLVLLIGVVLLILFATGVASEKTSTGGGTQTAANAEPPLKVTARELAAAYDANEAAAQEAYGNRRLEVTGTVDDIQLGLTNEPFIVYKGTNMFMGPQAHLAGSSRSKASSVRKGQELTVVCAGVSEVTGTAMLDECEIP